MAVDIPLAKEVILPCSKSVGKKKYTPSQEGKNEGKFFSEKYSNLSFNMH